MAYTLPVKRVKKRTRDKILLWMAEFIQVHHNAPTTLEIAAGVGISQTNVYNNMNKLVLEGRLIRVDGRWKIVGSEWIAPEDP